VQPDSELVRATIAGQTHAFEVLIRRYERSVRAAATNVVEDRHLASDVAQDAFLKAYQRLAALRRPEAFGPWLMQITRRCALDVAKRRRNQSCLAHKTVAATESGNGQLTEDKQKLLEAVMQLPIGERQVVMLRYFGHHTVREVAEICGRSVGTVTKQLSRAHERLRHVLKES
jgi:RNA polymerase sigma-70 factor (ECF subfamily)